MQTSSFFAWGRLIALVLVGLGFLGFGIALLISAYHLTDPFVFVLTFFSSNFIILISAALLVGFLIRAVNLRKVEDE
jgi:hypothetical protein